MTEFIYDAPRGMRTNRGFDSVTSYDMWYCHAIGKWVEARGPHTAGHSLSTHHNAWDGAPRTFKAFKSYLKRHPELKGRVMLCHRNYIPQNGKPDIHLGITAIL